MNVVGLSEVHRKGVDEIQTTEGHKLYYIGNDNKHINGVGFLINSEVTRMVMCFTPINDRIAIIRLHSTLLTNINYSSICTDNRSYR